MPREEAGQILDVIRAEANHIQGGLEIEGCGSYRRGKATCGDLDVLITHAEDLIEDVFERLLTRLREIGFVTDDLSIQRDGKQKKWLGVCKLDQPGKLATLDKFPFFALFI